MRDEEHRIQCAIAQFLTLARDPSWTWFAVPNGGYRNKVTAARLKAEGVRAGVFDLVVIHDGRAIGLEVKPPKKTLSDAQREYHPEAAAAGVPGYIVRSVEDVQRVLAAHGVPMRAR